MRKAHSRYFTNASKSDLFTFLKAICDLLYPPNNDKALVYAKDGHGWTTADSAFQPRCKSRFYCWLLIAAMRERQQIELTQKSRSVWRGGAINVFVVIMCTVLSAMIYHGVG